MIKAARDDMMTSCKIEKDFDVMDGTDTSRNKANGRVTIDRTMFLSVGFGYTRMSTNAINSALRNYGTGGGGGFRDTIRDTIMSAMTTNSRRGDTDAARLILPVEVDLIHSRCIFYSSGVNIPCLYVAAYNPPQNSVHHA